MRSVRLLRRRALAISAVVVAALLTGGTPTLAASGGGLPVDGVNSFFVDKTDSRCSDTGPGTSMTPYCTIAKGVSTLKPGYQLNLGNGAYTEPVKPAVSGTATDPIVITAWEGRSPVLGNGAINGVYLSRRSYITISHLTVTGTTGDGIYVSAGDHITIAGNTVTRAGRPARGLIAPGISLRGSRASTITGNDTNHNSDTGIYLAGGTKTSTVSFNKSSFNANGFQRNANGINVVSAGNTVLGNVTHDNEDSGVQFYPGGNDNLATLNVTYDNGDHGIDNVDVTGGRIIGNTAYRNCASGINVEGTSSHYTVVNNIAVDNGVYPAYNGTACSRRGGNISIRDSAPRTTTVDHNLVWLSTAGTMYDFGSPYPSLAAVQKATGQEKGGVQADPRFADAATWDLRLTEGSPAVDRGDSDVPGEQSTDILGNPRLRAPNCANSFASGTRLFDDLGAYELQVAGGPPAAQAPMGALTVAPSSGTAPLTVTADASGSTDPQGQTLTYAFDFGDGTTTPPQGSPLAMHTYAGTGSHSLKVRVANTSAMSSTATQTVAVTDTPPPAQTPTAALAVSPSSGTAPLTVTADASGSTDPQGQTLTYAFDFGDGQATTARSSPTITHTYATTGSYTLTVTVTNTSMLSSTAVQTVTVATTPATPKPPNAALTVTPSSGNAPLSVTADASGSSDPQGQTLSYAFDFGDGTSAPAQTSPTIAHTYASAGSFALKVTVTNTAALGSTATQTVAVTSGSPPPTQPPIAALTVTPSSGTAPLAVTANASGSSDPQGQILSYAFDFGDGTVVPALRGATLTHTYTSAGSFTLKVTVTNTSGLSSTAQQTVAVGTTGTTTAPTYVAPVATNYSIGSKTSGYVTVWRTGGVKAGDYVVLTLQLTGTPASGKVTAGDNAGNRYPMVADVANSTGGRLVVLAGIAGHPVPVNARITATFPAATGGFRLMADDFAGVTGVDASAAGSGGDAAATGASTGTAFASGPTAPTTGGREVAFGAVGVYGGTGSPVWGPGWKDLGSYAVGTSYLGRAYQLPSSAGRYEATGSGSGSWLALTVTFRP